MFGPTGDQFDVQYRKQYDKKDVLKNGVPIYTPPPVFNTPYEIPDLPARN